MYNKFPAKQKISLIDIALTFFEIDKRKNYLS